VRSRPDLVKVAIIVGKPRWPVGFDYVTLNILAPYGRLFTINDRLQFTQAYFGKLDSLGVGVIPAEFERISNEHGDKDLVLLCYENLTKPGEWCHRQVFAEWWLQETGEVIEELETGGEPSVSSPGTLQLPFC